MVAMPEHSTDRLATHIAQRRQCLMQMRDLGHKQSELIATGEMDSLLRLLAAKQKLLSALQTIERNLAPYHDEDPQQRLWSSPEARAQCAQQATDCRLLLKEVMQLEKRNEQQITLRRDQVANQLQTVHTASLARGAYQAQQTTTQRAASVGTPPTAGNHSPEVMSPSMGLDIQR
jgi:hypothetical protein